MAAIATALAVGLTVVMFQLLGPKRTRFIAQVAAAVVGATFVIGPGPTVHYEHMDDDSTDHAPLDEVLEAMAAAT